MQLLQIKYVILKLLIMLRKHRIKLKAFCCPSSAFVRVMDGTAGSECVFHGRHSSIRKIEDINCFYESLLTIR